LEFDDIERILVLVKQHDLAEFELERDGLKLRIRKAGTGFVSLPPQASNAVGPAPPQLVQPQALPAAGFESQVPAEEEEAPLELAVVKSPIVGTFYTAPEPGAPAFVEVGHRVKKDQVLCIIEAMKLMNEITSEYDGEIVNIYVESGKPVQYGERLFAIRTA
jgi:acetyl-CoA carboxylase biotin carboxyl carrier protein